MTAQPATVHAATPRIEKPQLLSLLWIYLLLNFIYCDVIGLHDAAILGQLLEGQAGPLQITPVFLLLSSVLMTIPISMVLVSRLAPRPANRVANIAAGLFMIAVQTASLFAGVPSPAYLFFSAIEIAGLVLIVVMAVRWRRVA